MIRKHKSAVILTFVVTLLPILVGLCLWNRLPESIATHFDMNNEPNGWSSRPFAVFGIPLFMAVMQVIMLLATYTDPKKKNISEKGFQLVIWIIPVVGLITCLSCYAVALGVPLNIGTVVYVFLGLLLMLLGNILPKNQSNFTFGIRTPWALNDPDNWAYSNRIAGYSLFIAGVLILVVSLLGKPILVFPIAICSGIVPLVASYVYYVKHKKE